MHFNTTLLVVLAITSFFSDVIALYGQCGENEEYQSCGTACQQTCNYSPKFCTLQCVPGCFCKPGFVRQNDDKSPCVPIATCSCSINEFFNPCGSACPDTCAARSQLCTRQCVPGCACKEGHVRANNRTNSPCIPISECSNTVCQDPHAEYVECGPACPRTCDDELDPVQKLRICPSVCRSGCFCKQGYVLGKDGSCVKPEVCCQAINASYSNCGSVCPRSCATKTTFFCVLPCAPGCFCDKDHVRKTNARDSPCVLRKDCN